MTSNSSSAGKKRRKKSNGRKALITLIVLLAAAAAVYIGFSVYFRTHFFPGTQINDTAVGGKTAGQAQEALQNTVNGYQLVITDRDGQTYRLKGTDFNLQLSETDTAVKDALSRQNPFLWVSGLFLHQDISETLSVSYDESALESAVSSLSCFSSENAVGPTDASIAYSEDSQQFEIIPETPGSTPDQEKVLSKVKDAVSSLTLSLSLSDDDYEQAAVTSADATITSAAATANSYIEKTITYDIYGETDSEQNFSIEKSRIASWITLSDDYQVTLDRDAISSYVQTLASQYNTYADEREFTTSLGDTISIGGGDYGWVIDKEGETEQLIADLTSGETTIEREPVYEQTAQAPGPNDIGDTYLEIDYTNQHFYYYKDGSLVLDSDIVSGNTSIGNGSPDGLFKIIYKQTDQTLKGEDYESPVDYFMPFAYNVGFHDASWRDTFGGEIYKSDGSHGCINLPSDIAEQLYNQVEVGTPVIAYYRDPVELTSENAQIANAYSYKDEDAEDNSDSADSSSEENSEE